MKKLVIALSICCAGLVYYSYRKGEENQRLHLVNDIYQAEHRILKDEIYELSQRPSYEEVKKSLLIRMGGPNLPSLYHDGFEDAKELFLNEGYQTGYHNCISQFGYKPSKTEQYLVPEPRKTEKQKEQDMTAKVSLVK